MSKKNFYAVAKGLKTGVFQTWNETKPLVLGFSGSLYKGFNTRAEADLWLKDQHHTPLLKLAPPHVDLKPHSNSHSYSNSHSPTQEVQTVQQDPVDHTGPVEAEIIYCDGSCTNNGYPSARAGIGVYFGPHDPRNISERLDPKYYDQTNNVAELVAAIKSIQLSNSQKPIIIRTDSIYVVKSMNKWRHNWIKNNWQRKRKPLENVSLQKELSNLIDQRSRPVTLEHVYGHSDCQGNIQADILATQGSSKDI